MKTEERYSYKFKHQQDMHRVIYKMKQIKPELCTNYLLDNDWKLFGNIPDKEPYRLAVWELKVSDDDWNFVVLPLDTAADDYDTRMIAFISDLNAIEGNKIKLLEDKADLLLNYNPVVQFEWSEGYPLTEEQKEAFKKADLKEFIKSAEGRDLVNELLEERHK